MQRPNESLRATGKLSAFPEYATEKICKAGNKMLASFTAYLVKASSMRKIKMSFLAFILTARTPEVGCCGNRDCKRQESALKLAPGRWVFCLLLLALLGSPSSRTFAQSAPLDLWSFQHSAYDSGQEHAQLQYRCAQRLLRGLLRLH